MPARPRWWLEIPVIIQRLENLRTPWLDRALVEQVFGVKRRRAIELLNVFGGFQAGRTFLIERDDLVQGLTRLRNSLDFRYEERRRHKLSEVLTEARQHTQARQVSIQVLPSCPGLPDGVSLEPGRMVITFRDVHDLLARLYGISQAAARDFETFQQAVTAFRRNAV